LSCTTDLIRDATLFFQAQLLRVSTVLHSIGRILEKAHSGDRSSGSPGFAFQPDIFIPDGLIAIGGDRPSLKPVSARVSADIFGSSEKARAPCRVAIGFASHAEASRVCDRVKKYCRKSSRRPLPKRIRKLRDVGVRRSRIYSRRERACTLVASERFFRQPSEPAPFALIADDRRSKKRNRNA